MTRWKVVYSDGGAEACVEFVNADTLDEAWDLARAKSGDIDGWHPIYVGSSFEIERPASLNLRVPKS